MSYNTARADLHVHSRCSDGSRSVGELVTLAAQRGLTAISLTDHDTVSGLPEALAWGIRKGVDIIPGIEISAYDFTGKRRIHLLGYAFDPRAPRIKALCDPLLRRRHVRTGEQIALLEEAGYPLTLREIREEAGEATALYKQHIMAHFMKKGLTDRIYSPLYRELFKGEGLCAGDMEYIDAFEALRAIQADGGLAVLAHPGQQDSFDLIPELARRGLWGLELNHEDNSEEDRALLADLARQYGLALTGGSDCHGDYGSDHELGDILAPEGLSLPRDGRLGVARKAVEEAARILRDEIENTPEGEWKNGDHRDLVTRHDRETEDYLVRTLSRYFPEDHFLTEETDRETDLNRGVVWIIDPIDGTTNFVHRRRDYAISVACYREGKPLFGLVKDVAGGNLFEGITGGGALLNGVPLEGKSSEGGLRDSLVDFSLNSVHLMRQNYAVDLAELAPLVCGHRAFGSASLILCSLATGDTHIYLSARLSLWDYAAAGIILRESGGDYREGPLCHREKGYRSGRVFLAWKGDKRGREIGDFLHGEGLDREVWR